MAIKLDLGSQREKDKAHPSQKDPDPAKKKNIAHANAAPRSQGRPKGDPAVTRSLRIRTDVNDLLVKEHQQSGLSYNEIVNRAIISYLNK